MSNSKSCIKACLACVIFASSFLFQSCGNADKSMNEHNMEDTSMPQKDHTDVKIGDMPLDNEMMQTMRGMMDQMNDMDMTGDFDFDFANMMIMHHKGAIEMSELEISKGIDAQLKTMAQTMINAQKAEIEILEKFIKNFKIPEAKTKDTDGHNELGEAMTAMMDAMHTIKMSGNTDKDFAMMMIPHHEAAVKMANDELSHGKSLELKKMALKMVSDQKKEIKNLKAWVANQK